MWERQSNHIEDESILAHSQRKERLHHNYILITRIFTLVSPLHIPLPSPKSRMSARLNLIQGHNLQKKIATTRDSTFFFLFLLTDLLLSCVRLSHWGLSTNCPDLSSVLWHHGIYRSVGWAYRSFSLSFIRFVDCISRGGVVSYRDCRLPIFLTLARHFGAMVSSVQFSSGVMFRY